MAQKRDRRTGPTRRRVLIAGAAAAGGTVLGSAAPAAAQSGADFDGWFDDVSNYDGVVDRTGQSEVTVEVGVENGDGPYGFGPASVRVDPGTTVTWEWTGQGGSHNVIAEEGSYESELVAEAGHTFSHTFEEAGVSTYFCQPHRALGMKGAVVVGDVSGGGGSGSSGGGDGGGSEAESGGSLFVPTDFTGWFALLFGGIMGLAVAGVLGNEARIAYRDHANAEEAYVRDAPVEAVEEETEVELDEEYDPVGTAALVVGYFVLISALWAFMYFVEYIGGPTITG